MFEKNVVGVKAYILYSVTFFFLQKIAAFMNDVENVVQPDRLKMTL